MLMLGKEFAKSAPRCSPTLRTPASPRRDLLHLTESTAAIRGRLADPLSIRVEQSSSTH